MLEMQAIESHQLSPRPARCSFLSVGSHAEMSGCGPSWRRRAARMRALSGHPACRYQWSLV